MYVIISEIASSQYTDAAHFHCRAGELAKALEPGTESETCAPERAQNLLRPWESRRRSPPHAHRRGAGDLHVPTAALSLLSFLLKVHRFSCKTNMP